MKRSYHRPRSWWWKLLPHTHLQWQPEPGGFWFCWWCGRNIVKTADGTWVMGKGEWRVW